MPTSAPNATLILIDLQQGMADPRAGRRNNPGAEAVIGRLLAHWREATRPVVHVRHMSRNPQSLFYPGQPGCEFQPALQPLADEHVAEKNVPDAFVSSGLERWLRVRDVRQLVIVGVSTNNSVEATARSAGNLGFDVQVVADATFTFDLQGHDGRLWPAEDVHAMALSNLALDYALIVDSDTLLVS